MARQVMHNSVEGNSLRRDLLFWNRKNGHIVSRVVDHNFLQSIPFASTNSFTESASLSTQAYKVNRQELGTRPSTEPSIDV